MRLLVSCCLVAFTSCLPKSKEETPAPAPSKALPESPSPAVSPAFTERPLFNSSDLKDLGIKNGKPGSVQPTSPLPVGSSTTSASFSWKGRRAFTWSGGKNPSGGATPVVTYAITVRDGQGGYDVQVEADGTQTMIRMSGGGVENGDALSVGFKSCGAEDRTQCSGIHVGDGLFTLTRDAGGVWLVFGKMGAPDDTTKRIRAAR